ncbi:class I SAM-dependent methyltransferase [Amaricoccus solimangrovi]|uniref:Methyltransferase domain-containing protein n=1 Tax=Amaricoccus solimangrovi TaxID=2589815 RepID=A0A501WUM2_9RHOB|nr:class I SAM-dependent methyltransferase [Amaricoccus solimangrovi]TPE53118.1 methyltransferase domain-containing protein [Amaricoccus solimangrovi]
MSVEERVARHYAGAGLHERILERLAEAGVTAGEVTAEHLKAVDEFHIGGAEATTALLDQLAIGPETRVLDIGCGIGGPARMIATRFGAQVTGVDLTPDFVETARRLCEMLGIEARFVTGSALDLPFPAASFDLATLLHVGMNLPDKPRLFAEAARVLVPGGTFAVYDVMRFGDHPAFPLPWASEPSASFLEPPEAYLAAAGAAGFELAARRDRGEVAKAFFARIRDEMAGKAPPAVGLPLLLGDGAPVKVANMMAAVSSGDIQPVEMIFRARN